MKRPLRVALVAACPFPSPQGSQVFVGQMAERLAEAGHGVHLLTYGQGFEVFGKGYRHHRTMRLPGDDAARSGPTAVKPLLDLLLVRALVGLCRREQIDVVHAHNYEAAAAALAARALTAVPVVYHSHNLMGDELETYFERRGAKAVATACGNLLDRTIPRRADRTIALCDYSAESLLRAGCDAARLAVIPPAVDDDGPAGNGSVARAALGLGADDFVVGYCGNLDGYQNLGLLIDAFALAVAGSRREPMRTSTGRAATIAAACGGRREGGPGPGPAGPVGKDRLASLALLLATHRLDRSWAARLERRLAGRARAVEVHGYAEARAAVAACDLLVLPRRLGSGYPVKLLNWMSAAKPILTAGCGSKVLRDGVDGVVVRDDDPEAMAAAIVACAGSPDGGLELGRAARRTFLATATWEAVLAQIETVYRGLAGARAADGGRLGRETEWDGAREGSGDGDDVERRSRTTGAMEQGARERGALLGEPGESR